MVCSKCQKFTNSTILATPGIKKKSEIYFGSSGGSNGDYKARPSSIQGHNGIGKARRHSKLLSKAAKNPYSSSSCKTCKTRIEQGRTFCQKCAYKANACLVCGKSNSKSTASAPIIEGQKFNLK
ncbi:unnamed protein product [Blumeria hordei]|uniref:Cysteine-rich PDZ-binding protein n=1 Tax=Blumeria hordei TaxID=2867405 RepID=A0A383V0I8_BLUHO|nr:unnamed protein product [Blumeria hordei]